MDIGICDTTDVFIWRLGGQSDLKKLKNSYWWWIIFDGYQLSCFVSVAAYFLSKKWNAGHRRILCPAKDARPFNILNSLIFIISNDVNVVKKLTTGWEYRYAHYTAPLKMHQKYNKKLSYRRETARQLHTSFSAHSLIVRFTEHRICFTTTPWAHGVYNRLAKLVWTLSANKPCDILTLSWIRHSRSSLLMPAGIQNGVLW